MAARRAIASASRTSCGIGVALPPAARICRSSSLSASVPRAMATTCAPASASTSAVAAPMPREAPVTRAMRSARGRDLCIFDSFRLNAGADDDLVPLVVLGHLEPHELLGCGWKRLATGVDQELLHALAV